MAHFTNVRALAFDLDGTLTDSAPGLARAVDGALSALDLPAAGIERVSTWIGNGADVLIERALTWALGHPRKPVCCMMRACCWTSITPRTLMAAACSIRTSKRRWQRSLSTRCRWRW